MKIPIVSIVGKPNVGKSMLFNRLVGSRKAITADEAGTTRDRIFHKVERREMDYFVVDTGGLEFENKPGTIENDMQKQAQIAIDESDMIVFLINHKETLTSSDFKVAELLRTHAGNKPVLLVLNKCDQPAQETDLAYAYELGLGDPLGISALHNTGVDVLDSTIIKTLKERHFLTKQSKEFKAFDQFEKACLNIALAGKTNVGKSSIINALLNQEKLIVSATPHTTRDSIDSAVKHGGKVYNFIDTAGMRRQGKIGRGVEHFSVLRTLAAIDRSDIGLLVLDSSKPITHQDQRIANALLDAGTGVVILANKWDLKDEEESEAEEKRRDRYIRHLQVMFPFLSWAPVLFTSAVTKKNLSLIFDQAEAVDAERKKRISTARLNRFLDKAIESHKPSGTKAISPKVFYITQGEVEPPNFVFFVNKKKYFHFSYLRYMENRLRDEFGFTGTPIVMSFQEKEARYSNKKK